MLVTGRKEVRPIEDVAAANFEWENSVFVEIRHLKYIENYYNLPPEMRTFIEKEA